MADEPLVVEPQTAEKPPVEVRDQKPRKASRAGFFRRLTVGTNVLLQIALLVFILVAVNGYSYKHFHRFDFSRDRKEALSERTRRLLGSLNRPDKQPVRIIVFMVPDRAGVQADMANLAEEYRVAQPKAIAVEQVHPYRDAKRASDIITKYKLIHQEGNAENVVIVDAGQDANKVDHFKIIKMEEMVQIDRSGEMMGEAPRVSGFTGEQAISSAILEVTEGKKNTVYYTQGHGESGIEAGKSLEFIGKLFEVEHVTASEINLLNIPVMPADATALLLIGPRFDLTEGEIKLLTEYWNKGGRIFLLLNPDAQTPRLAAFLATVGITPENDRLVFTQEVNGQTYFVRNPFVELVGTTAITTQLPPSLSLGLVGSTQTLTLDAAKVAPVNVRVEPLLTALKGFWGETDYADMENGVFFDPAKDKAAPLYAAATVQKGALGDQRVQTGSGRMVVIGNSRFVENDVLEEKAVTFFRGSLNWLLEREALIGVAPKQVKVSALRLSEDQVRQMMWLMCAAIPGTFAFIGVIVWFVRRR